jgi:hypothetical protein
VTERLTGTLQSNGKDYWVVSQDYYNPVFLAYAVTSDGVNTTPVISYAAPDTGWTYWGYMRISPDGSKLCYADFDAGIPSQLYDFNNTTGAVSNRIALLDSSAYGAEFSPDNSKLYLSNPGPYFISQYDLSAGSPTAIQNSRTVIVYQGYDTITHVSARGGAIALGPDNKIYSNRLGQSILSVINNPNLPGALCNFADTGVVLDAMCQDGLPNFIKAYASTLPLTLKNFDGSISGNSTYLTWITFDEINTAADIVERSYDGINFSIIGSLPAKGSTQINKYQFTDHPSFAYAEVYYRLKFIDKDGHYTYSNIITLSLASASSLIIIQNPIHNNLQISINSPQTNHLSIFDFSGRILNSFNAQSGVQNIDVSSLTAGTYMLQMLTADGHVYDKLFVKGN